MIERKSAKFHPEKFKSHYLSALKGLIDEKKRKGKVTPATDEELETESNVIDLMDALERSVGRRDQTRRASPKRRRTAARKRASPKSSRSRGAHSKRKAG